ncbi:MAG: DUF5719 family protein [Bifidobacteriaceae bacterium]|jgi:hypothetical protein|nr:DUF5719 family protein [Bifidobacteriaceae bacterium]
MTSIDTGWPPRGDDDRPDVTADGPPARRRPRHALPEDAAGVGGVDVGLPEDAAGVGGVGAAPAEDAAGAGGVGAAPAEDAAGGSPVGVGQPDAGDKPDGAGAKTQAKRRSRARTRPDRPKWGPARVARRIVAIVTALALAAAAAALGYADRVLEFGSVPAASPQVVDVPPGDSVTVCPGVLKRPTEGEDDVVYDPRFDPDPTMVEAVERVIVEGGEGGRVAPIGEGSPTRLTGPLSVATRTVEADPDRVEADSTEDEPAIAAGAVFQHLGDGDLRGVAASACVEPATESWIVAGSTEPGSSARLVLVNAGYTTVTAELKLWDAAGPVDAVGLTGLVVPAQSQRAVLLEGFVGDAVRLAAHVTAAGGQLAAFLQHSRLEGLVQGGVELAVPGLAPAKTVTVPGLNVAASSFDSARASAIRVVNPGVVSAAVSVELWGPDGPTSLPGLEETSVGPGLVSDLSLAGLPEGDYTAVISSDEPVAAAGLSLRGAGADGPEEFAWTNSTAAAERALVALPAADLVARLAVSSGEAATVAVTPIGRDSARGLTRRFAVSAGTTVSLGLDALGADAINGALELVWDGPAGLAALTVAADSPDGEMISTVVPRGHWAAAQTVAVYPLAR